VSRPVRHPSALNPVIVGMRSGSDELPAHERALELATQRHTHLVVVHVIPATSGFAIAVPTAAGAVALTSEELADRCHLDCELALAGADLDWSFEIRAGDAATALADAAHRHRAACVVVGRHDHKTSIGRFRCTGDPPRGNQRSSGPGRAASRHEGRGVRPAPPRLVSLDASSNRAAPEGPARGTSEGPQPMSRSVPAPMADKLLATAGELALSWDEVRTEDIAEASGIPRATLYYYFSSKDEILQFLLTRMLERLTDAVAAAEDPDAAIPDRLAAVVRAQLAHLGEFPATAQLLTANLGKAGKLPDLAAGINAAFHEPVRRLLALGAANGTLRPVDPEIAATALYGAVTVIGLRSLVIDNHLDVDEVSGQILPLFWSGIRPNARS